ncbi:MAG: class II aldolase/adducin family protein [Caldisericaceae bacterium]|nr:class II aldolase/adducin family protein [Caldisericaceae bacterium]
MKRAIKEEIANMGKRLYERRLNGGYGGNISVKDDEVIYITPSGLPKDILQYSDIIVMDFKGNVLEGTGKPSSEMLFHILIYKTREDVNAIIHSHPPLATGFAIAGKEIPPGIHEESTIVLGKVPVLPYEVTSSKELAKNVSDALSKSNAALLANHGAITVGDTLETAFRRMEELENLCEMILVAQSIGKVNKIPQEKLEALLELIRKRTKKS